MVSDPSTPGAWVGPERDTSSNPDLADVLAKMSENTTLKENTINGKFNEVLDDILKS